MTDLSFVIGLSEVQNAHLLFHMKHLHALPDRMGLAEDKSAKK